MRRLSMLLVSLLIAGFVSACSSTPDSSATSSIDGTLTPDAQRQPLTGDDIIFDDNLSDTSRASADGLTTPPPAELGGTQEDLVTTIGDRVFFGYDSSELTAEAREVLDKQANWLRTYPNVMATIEGHADERGTREYNLALGERRANAVKNYLVALGIETTRLTVVSYGKERPAVLGSNASSWARNRRGVMVVN